MYKDENKDNDKGAGEGKDKGKDKGKSRKALVLVVTANLSEVP